VKQILVEKVGLTLEEVEVGLTLEEVGLTLEEVRLTLEEVGELNLVAGMKEVEEIPPCLPTLQKVVAA